MLEKKIKIKGMKERNFQGLFQRKKATQASPRDRKARGVSRPVRIPAELACDRKV